MKVVVQDANIIIDMLEGSFFDLWFALGVETHTTNLILNELNRPDQRAQVDAIIRSKKLQITTLSSEGLVDIALIRMERDDLTIQDCSVLKLSEELDAILLTGDKDLREFADSRHLEVHGTLWILDKLVASKLLTPFSAAEKLTRLLATDRRLPGNDCALRLKKWRATK